MNLAPPALYLWDDAHARAFEPFALTRPVSELRAGAELIRRRWERLLGVTAQGFVSAAHLAQFSEPGSPRGAVYVPTGALVVNARLVPTLAAVPGADQAAKIVCDGRLGAVRIAGPIRSADLLRLNALEDLPAATGDSVTLPGRWLNEVWDLIGTLDDQLREDVAVIAPMLESELPEGAIVLGDHDVVVEVGARVEPAVCFDVTAGPILIRRGASVAAFTRLVGPCVIGEDAIVLGGRVAMASIGERCKVQGEVNHVVFLGYSNKGHDGFVGHSYLGRWVNLGAGTVTSNMKNTYGPVSLWTPHGVRETGLQFLGTLFGDHVKTGIGTRLTTGSVIGAGASVFGNTMPPKHVPPFAWGDGAPFASFDIERFLLVAERAMRRRDVTLTGEARRLLTTAHALSRGEDGW